MASVSLKPQDFVREREGKNKKKKKKKKKKDTSFICGFT